MHLEMSVSKILTQVLQNYEKFIEMTSNMIYIVGLQMSAENPFEHTVPPCTTDSGGPVQYLGLLTMTDPI